MVAKLLRFGNLTAESKMPFFFVEEELETIYPHSLQEEIKDQEGDMCTHLTSVPWKHTAPDESLHKKRN